uniref:Uncharacterized protein n=1 Tax=Aegilops tauschii TaxID=37682 RepID=M8BJ86_AEGTA
MSPPLHPVPAQPSPLAGLAGSRRRPNRRFFLLNRASTSSDAPWLLLPPPTTRCKGGRRRRAERRQQPPLPHPAPPQRVTVSLAALHLDVEHCPPMRDRTNKALLPPSSPWIQLLLPADSRRHEVTSGAAGGVKAIKW